MRRLDIIATLALAAAPAGATDYQTEMGAYLDQGHLAWVTDAVLVNAVRAQNAATADLTEDEIIALDNSWQAQVGTAESALVDSVLSGPTSDFLRSQVAASEGAITEIVVMDARGLSVAISHLTWDYWEGDEETFQHTYGIGPGAVYFGDIELDETGQRYQAQISVTLVDPDTGEAIGAVSVGVDARALTGAGIHNH